MAEPIWAWDQVHLPTDYEEDDDNLIFKDVVIAREIVHEYDDGMAYKPAQELEDAYWTLEHRWAIAGRHPRTAVIMDRDDIHGRTVNVRFTKSLKDPKTKRPNNRGILADLTVFKNKVAPDVISELKTGKLRDVSIGFFFDKDETAGTIDEDGHPLNGSSYDYIQRKFMFDHTAFALEDGRCPMPFCGIGADEIFTARVTGDPFAGYQSFSECIEDIMKKNPKYTKEMAAGTCAEIEKRSKAKKDFKSEGESRLSMNRLSELKSKLNDVLSGIDDLVEEEAQGNESIRTQAELAKAYFSISDKEWEALTDEEKQSYISKLPPEPSEDTSEDMDCTYEWEILREKLFESDKWTPLILSPILGEMTFDDGNVSMSKETVEKLKELGIDLEPCEEEEEETTEEDIIEENEQDDYDEIMAPHLAEDAVLSYAAKKALPDTAYAYIEPGCKKEDGKTQQKCRHMPIHDPAHVRAALAALKGARTGKVPAYASKAKPKICSAARKFKIESEVCGTKGDIDADELIQKIDRTLKDRDLFEP